MSLGTDRAAILREWGEPERVTPTPRYTYYYNRYNVAVTFDSADRVVALDTWHPDMRTPEGIGVGSTRTAVLAAYGPHQFAETKTDRLASGQLLVLQTLIYFTRGIMFTTNRKFAWDAMRSDYSPIEPEHTVAYIIVFPPR